MLNDLWKKFKSPPTSTSSTNKGPNEEVEVLEEPLIPSPTLNLNTDAILENYRQNEFDSLQMNSVLSNLQALKTIVNQPKEDFPEIRFSKIQKHLGTPESHETVRQERWQPEIYCPKCKSINLKRIAQIPPQSPHNHRYRCLDCETIFNDDSGTPFSRGLPSLNIWMQCWYLMGCTDSLTYIAAKLNLDLATVEIMARQLQQTFNAKQPLTRFKGFEEWNQQSQHLRVQLKEDLLRQYEKLNANLATAPKDTAEHRRQETLRRDPTLKTPPGVRRTK